MPLTNCAMKRFFFLPFITVLVGLVLPLEALAQPYYVIYHDNAGNVITYDEWKEGYTFNSSYPAFFLDESYANSAWSTAPNGDGTVYLDGQVLSAISSNLSVYAVVRRGYYISFDSQGGSPVDNEIVYQGQPTVKPIDPTRSGYSFAGWQKQNGDSYVWGGVLSSDMTLKAVWTPTSSDYTVRIWIENPNHLVRSSLADAIANAGSDYTFKGSYIKSGTPCSDVSITESDHTSELTKNYINYTNIATSFPVYFCDDSYRSYALSMTNASIAAANAAGGISSDGTTVVDVYYRSLVYDVTLSSGTELDKTSYNLKVKPLQLMNSAITNAGITIDKRFFDILNVDIHEVEYNMSTNTANGFSTSGEALYWDSPCLDIAEMDEFIKSPISDEFKVTYTLVSKTKGKHEFVRAYYHQTLESAKSGRNLSYADSTGNYQLVKRQIYRRSETTMFDGCILDINRTGFTLFYHHIVSDRADIQYDNLYGRNKADAKYYRTSPASGWTEISCQPGYNTRKFNYLPFANTADATIDNGKWQNVQYKLKIFYKRNSYTMSFVTKTNKIDVSPVSVFYEDTYRNQASRIVYKDASGFHPFVVDQTAYTDDAGVVWVFKGWYDNEACTGARVDFSTSSLTMPAYAVQFFAKWERKQVTVTFDAGDGTVSGAKKYTVTIDSGMVPNNIGPAIPKAGLSFYCWMYKGMKYNFDKPIYDNVALTALYYSEKTFKLTYSTGAGSGKAPVDQATYLVGANTLVTSPSVEMLPPSWKKFECWQDKNGVRYCPGDPIVISENTTLTAVYATYLTGLTIETSGMKAGHSSIFTVCVEGGTTPLYTLVITADASGKGSASVDGLTSGRYTVIETPWNWTYSSTGGRVLTQDLEENSVFRFGSSSIETRPANDEKSVNNWHE